MSTTTDPAAAPAFDWTLQPQAAALVTAAVAAIRAEAPWVDELAQRIEAETSTYLTDWIDHVSSPTASAEALTAAGFELAVDDLWRHPGAQLPALVVGPPAIAVRVDDVDTFVSVNGGTIEGSPHSALRTARVERDGAAFIAVERRSWSAGRTPEVTDEATTAARAAARQAWHSRPRTDAEAIPAAIELASAQAGDPLVGADLAGSYFAEAERIYWETRNHAARVQGDRQRAVGLGWGNHDHHTFRCSRSNFLGLLAFFDAVGFSRRERYHAGAEAGWGAQVLEHHGAGLVVFADVDLLADEVDFNFAELPLPETPPQAVGTWCALFGDSIGEAGMHHLEGQFDFDALRRDLAAAGIEHRTPFSDFPYLRQAFTVAEQWTVPAERLDALVADGVLTSEMAATYGAEGAPGSHLENLARTEGFKGFNQHSVSVTIAETDLRAGGG